MRWRSIQPLLLSLLLLAVATPAADAFSDGRGLYGATDDKVVVDAAFILIIFFPVFVFTMSMLLRHLEKRKAARKAAASHMGDAQWRGGW